MQKARLAVHHRSACSGLKALRNTSVARRQAAKLCYRFGPLTPSARSANLIAGDGTKNGFPAPNKEPAKNQKRLLDRKNPIQVRIPPPSSAECAANLTFRGRRRQRVAIFVEVANAEQQEIAMKLFIAGIATETTPLFRFRSDCRDKQLPT